MIGDVVPIIHDEFATTNESAHKMERKKKETMKQPRSFFVPLKSMGWLWKG
jgi:hypothetical protein